MYKHYSPISHRAACGDTVPEIALTAIVSDVSCPICQEKIKDIFSANEVVVSLIPDTIADELAKYDKEIRSMRG